MAKSFVYDFETSKAFIKPLSISPYQSGQLDNLTFAVKDLIDIAGEVTGSGNPTWAKTHCKAAAHAICVEQLLSEGATCLGKTITDELAYSLIGENYFYGTPVNPKASDRVPGGSSSGSAAAVACGLVDFALGTDTGGSVRVPASNCGIYGYRPSHGSISVAGVNPFGPSFDTVGVLANDAEILKKVMSVLLGISRTSVTTPIIILLDDIFSICDATIQETLFPIARSFEKNFSIESLELKFIDEQVSDFKWLFDTYTFLQGCEIWSTLGAWIESEEPEFGPVTQSNFTTLLNTVDRTQIHKYIYRRTTFSRNLNEFLGANKVLCFPTTPTLAPTLGSMKTQPRNANTYYLRALAINAISGLSSAPQMTLPLGEVDGIPIGLSFLAANDQDDLLCALL